MPTAAKRDEAPATQVVKIGRNAQYDVYCGRPGKWGNRYRIGPDGSRSEVIEKHRLLLNRHIEGGNISLEEIAALDGKRLGCYCAPKPCHAGNLAQVAAAAKAALKALAGFTPDNGDPRTAMEARRLAKLAAAAGENRSLTLQPDGRLAMRLRDDATGEERVIALSPDGTVNITANDK